MTSDYDYKDIEKFGAETYEWYKGMLLKERLLLGNILELFLESVSPLQEFSKDTDYRKLALLTLATRLFNDSEGASYLLLRGFPAQAQMVIRNIIESTMLFRLFLRSASPAKRWIMGLAEFQPGDVNAKLLGIGINAREYAFYGIFSHEGHANFLASIANVQEEEVDEGMRRTFHFGSSRTPSTIFFVHHSFLDMFFLLHLLLMEPLAEYYSQHSDADVYRAWAEKVDKLIPQMESLATEASMRKIGGKPEVDKQIMEQVEKKLRLRQFKNILSRDSNDETTKIE